MHAMPRRAFLTRAVGVLAFLGLAPAGALARSSARRGATVGLGHRIREMFAAPGHARDVGSAYLARYPRGRSSAWALATSLMAADPDGPDELYALLRRRRERDFRADRIVVLEGWIMSATEAQTCALVSLL